MDFRESSQLAGADELRHWWMRTRLLYLDRALGPEAARGPLSVLDAGCGTGGNLRYLRRESPLSPRIARLTGFDSAWPAGSRPEWLGAQDAVSSSEQEAAARGPFDALLAMDVLEHVDDDLGTLRRWAGRLKPGGLAFITVPAFPALWSYHDELLLHKRRYTLGSLLELAREAGLKPVRARYGFGFLFPPAYVLRVLLGGRRAGRGSTDLHMPAPWVNGLLSLAGRLEVALGGCRRLGTSVVASFRK